MTHHRYFVPALLLCAAALAWGCTKPPVASADEKTKSLEARVAKLEQDVKATAAARDGLQQKLTAAEGRAASEAARAVAAEKARDEAKAALTARTAERDAAQTQFEAFRKTIRELVGTAETAAAPPLPAIGTTSPISLPVPPRLGL